ncbi:MAG: type I restriction-modification system subunit M [Sinobacteraceae bacterium]|nr:type I restriction-modification system subunit M [Nevskiaceae bacterium]
MTETEFKKYLWEAANNLRGSVDAATYKYPVLGLVFLKYISDVFAAQRTVIAGRLADPKSDYYVAEEETRYAVLADFAEDRDFYTQDNVFWVPKDARYPTLLAQAAKPDLGQLLDGAIASIEKENPKLRGILYRDFARLALEKGKLGELMAIIAKMQFDSSAHGSRDVFGEVYEYLLGEFAIAEGKKAGQFYTARSVVRTLVAVLAPYEGRVYDPCCGSGGMFVYSEKFLDAHGGKRSKVSIYGQELSATTRKLASMNLAIRGIDYDLGHSYGDTFHNDQHPDLRADYVLANPPFNMKNWGAAKLADDPRWQYGVPPEGNANYAWLQHIVARLAFTGRAGVVLANGSMTTATGGEGSIREAMVRGDLVECMVALPGQLFANTPIPVCLWFLSKDKDVGVNGTVDRRRQVLFIDARKLGKLLPDSRKQKALSSEDIDTIAGAYHAWRGTRWAPDTTYEDQPGFCKLVTLEDIEKQGFALTPGRYVGMPDAEDDGVPFDEKMRKLTTELFEQMDEAVKLDAAIRKDMEALGYGE